MFFSFLLILFSLGAAKCSQDQDGSKYSEQNAKQLVHLSSCAYNQEKEKLQECVEKIQWTLHAHFEQICDKFGERCASFLAYSRAQRRIAFIFRGTFTYTQLLSQFSQTNFVGLVPFHWDNVGTVGKANVYFLQALFKPWTQKSLGVKLKEMVTFKKGDSSRLKKSKSAGSERVKEIRGKYEQVDDEVVQPEMETPQTEAIWNKLKRQIVGKTPKVKSDGNENDEHEETEEELVGGETEEETEKLDENNKQIEEIGKAILLVEKQKVEKMDEKKIATKKDSNWKKVKKMLFGGKTLKVSKQETQEKDEQIVAQEEQAEIKTTEEAEEQLDKQEEKILAIVAFEEEEKPKVEVEPEKGEKIYPRIALWDCMLESYELLDPEIRSYQVVFSGHSLGGALASLAALRWALQEEPRITQEHRKVSKKVQIKIEDLAQQKVDIWASQSEAWLYTFGQPRVGTPDYSHQFDALIPNRFRVVNGNDVVPHLPPCNQENWLCNDKNPNAYFHHGIEIWYPYRQWGEFVECPINEDPKCSDSVFNKRNKGNNWINLRQFLWQTLKRLEQVERSQWLSELKTELRDKASVEELRLMTSQMHRFRRTIQRWTNDHLYYFGENKVSDPFVTQPNAPEL